MRTAPAASSLLFRFFLFTALVIGGMRPVTGQTFEPGFNDALVMGGWTEPVGATWDGNGRMYVWEKRGMVWIVENGVRLTNPLIDISAEVGNWRDHGCLGFALDPNFLSNGRIYLMYGVDRHHLLYFGTSDYYTGVNEYYSASIMRITRYTATGPSYNTVNHNTRLVLVGETRQTGVPMTHESHSTGSLVFGEDGTLLASVGDGASYNVVDTGSDPGTYYVQALADGIIRPEENVGAMRSQMVNSHNGKVLRIDPSTGNGIPSNPWYDSAQPRAPKSRVWAMGLRNPYRMTIRPGTGNPDPAAGDPGTLSIGDVGWDTWEELNVAYEGGMNFGWPIFEGMEPQITPNGGYSGALTQNLDAPNPLYNGTTCTRQYFYFQELLKQETLVHTNAHPNPCNSGVQIPNTIPKHFHSRPAIDWKHGNQSRCGAFSGNAAVAFDLDAVGSPVPGPRFGGYTAMAGPWISGANMPAGYQNSSFHGDYALGWIRRFMFDANDQPVSVHDFASGLGNITWIGSGPDGCIWYFKYSTNELRRICYSLAVNLPPAAVATQNVQYGPGPLSVNFNGSGSSDPENGAITYLWNFGDGTPTSTVANPSHVFTAPAGVPTTYTITLTVRDDLNQPASVQLIVSVNNTPPMVSITSIPMNATYPVGVDTTFQLQATVSDAEHGPGQLSYAWRTTLHHNTHTHPESIDTNVSSSTVISGSGCDGNTFFYDVTLKVTDAGGLSTSVMKEIHPRCYAIAPTAIIEASQLSGPGPLLVVLDGTDSYDPGTIVSYAWDFGDGTTSSSPSPSKVFSESGNYQVTLTVTDDDGLTGQAVKVIRVLTFDPPLCVGGSGLFRQYYTGVNGNSVSDLLNSPNYPNSPTSTSTLSLFQGPSNIASSYGTRVRGYIIPPQTGNYTFNVTSDDNSVVYLGLNAEPQTAQLLCSVPGATTATGYTTYPSQTSVVVALQAGVYYYVELLHKEGSGSDHFALRWKTPSNSTWTIIPGTALAQWVDCPPSVRVRANLQGPWDPTVNMMKDGLRSGGLIPTTEPYTGLGFTQIGGGGGETVSLARLAVTGKNAVVDWVFVELRNKNNPATIVATRCALLERDGDITGTNGYGRLLFNVPADNYFVAVRHRNHLGAMTFAAVALSATEVGIDFTLGSQAAWGTDARKILPNSARALWCGNTLRDATLKYTNSGNDRDPILLQIGGSVPTATSSGYLMTDVDLDGMVRYVGQSNDRDPILQNIGGTVPTAVRTEQLP